ncbi:MAG: crotonobetainyl-CoA--carnitine CoA-transferase [Magnetospirillum sp.]|nr:crotonobetainyl-CoA--carnitine CoA-transferase [Magnetospirillum sp.]
MAATPPNTDFSPRSSEKEKNARQRFCQSFSSSPIPLEEMVYSQLSLYLPRQELARLLALADIYRQHVIETNGVLMEFGTCWGRTAALLTNLRGIFEPYNFTRRLAVFDTFGGLAGTGAKDGQHALAVDGAYSTGEGYEAHLEGVLAYHESEAPIPHIRKFELMKGDASQTLPAYLDRHPETIVAMAYFDFDIYKPTRDCLERLKPCLSRGSVLVFDQLNCPEYPGETVALAEVFGLNRCLIRRSPLTPWMSYMICDQVG